MTGPTKLNDVVIRIICEELERGVSLKTAAYTAGLKPGTVYGWVDQGRKAKTGRLKEFADRVERSKLVYIEHHAQRIRDAAETGTTVRRTQIFSATGELVREEVTEIEKPDWRAAQFLLEKVDPENWARTPEVNVSQNVKVDAQPRKVVLEIVRPDGPEKSDDDDGSGDDPVTDTGGGGPNILAS